VDRGPVKSATRVLDILELFEAERRPMRVVDIVDRLGTPQSSVSMLLKTMVARGYIVFDADSREYCPSVRVSFLGGWILGRSAERNEVQDSMRWLADGTGETALLGRQSGMFMQYLSVIESQYALRLSITSGTKRPIHRAAIGIVLLSRLEDDPVQRLLRRYNAEFGKTGAPADIPKTMRAIESARKLGYHESLSLSTPGAGVIAALLPKPIRGQHLAIGVGAPAGRLHQMRAKLTAAVLAAANRC